MNKQTVFILCGPSGSGKSRYVGRLKRERPNLHRVNRDAIREMLDPTGDSWEEPSFENLVTDLEHSAVRKLLCKGFDIVVDNTHLRPEHVKRLVDTCHEISSALNTQLDTVLVPIKEGNDLEAILKHNASRPNRQTLEEVVRNQHGIFTQSGFLKNMTAVANTSTSFHDKMYYGDPSPLLPKVVLVDIDGTVADCRGIRSPFDYSLVLNDRFMSAVWFVARAVADEANAKVIFLSGREEGCRKETEEWMEYHALAYDKLLMRSANDLRKDSIVKKEIYEANIKGKYEVIAVFDDRLSVCRMWHSLGLPLFRVGNPDSEI